MFIGFKVENIGLNGALDHYYKIGANLYERNKADLESRLEPYILKHEILSANLISGAWFPQIDGIQIFLSHSHCDVKTVTAFVGWLKEELGVDAFIDSLVWGYCEELIRQISRNCEGITEAQVRAHVHIMLNSALAKMIDNTECFMFIDTPESISMQDILCNRFTFSPWIYSELLLSKFIRRRPLEQHPKRFGLVQEGWQFAYNVTEYLENLEMLTVRDLNLWRDNVKIERDLSYSSEFTPESAMDILYNKKLPKTN